LRQQTNKRKPVPSNDFLANLEIILCSCL